MKKDQAGQIWQSRVVKMHRSLALRLALDAIDEFEKTGLALVPVEPDEDMLMRGPRGDSADLGTSRRIYNSMIEAELGEDLSVH